jgi:hypothetical protein
VTCYIYIGSPMVCDVIWFLSNKLCVFYPRALKTHNHITSQNMGDSFYHIFITPYLFLLTLFFGRRGVGIHNVITKNYHMSVITLICDKNGLIWWRVIYNGLFWWRHTWSLPCTSPSFTGSSSRLGFRILPEKGKLILYNYWLLMRLTSSFINPGNVIFTEAIYHIPWVDKSRGQPISEVNDCFIKWFQNSINDTFWIE